jgi:hypothetical protein
MAINDRVDGIREQVAACEALCIQQGEFLVEGFRRERIALQKRAFADKRTLRNIEKPHRVGSWCPLNLFCRFHNGSLQIYWQLVHRDKRTRSIGYKHLSKNKRGGYDLRSLLAHAHDFERELVAEYEEEAECQRQRWQHLMKAKHYLQRLGEVNRIETTLLRRSSGQPYVPPVEAPIPGNGMDGLAHALTQTPTTNWMDP